jgi:CRISPR-associated protein Csb2
MHRVLLLSVRLHDGGYNGAGDWPPSPARLFQALVAGTARGQTIADQPKAALCWLESLDAPIIAAPTSRAGQGFRNFVPNNDLDAVGGDLRRIGVIRTSKMIRPHLFNAAHPFLYAWSFEPGEAAERHAQAIAGIAERLYQLGRGVDMAWAWGEVVAAAEAEARLAMHGGVVYQPGRAGEGTTLAVPIQGSLDILIERHKETRKRFQTLYESKPTTKEPEGRAAAGQIFSQPRKPRFRQVAYDTALKRSVFDLIGPSVPWRLERTAELAERVRDAAAARLKNGLPGKEACIERVLIGRDATEADKAARVRIIPLPSVGHPHADHAIRRVLVEIPPNCPVVAADIEWCFSGLDLSVDHQTGEVISGVQAVLIPAGDDGMLDHYGIDRSACVWRTVTPAALPRAATRGRIGPSRLPDRAERKGAYERGEEQNRAASAVAQALRHVGVGAGVATIRVQREPFTGKGERAESFAPNTRFAKERLWHVEIIFAQPVGGPLIIGDGRYLGLGLMEPAREARRDLVIFGLAAEPGVAISDRSALLSAVRRALMSLSRRSDGSVPRLFSGHETDGAPAQSGRHEHVFLSAADLDGDGYIDRLIIIPPWRCDRSVQPDRGASALFDRTVSELEVVRAGKLGIVSFAGNAADVEDRRLVGPARIWESHTCYGPTRPVRRGDNPVEVLRRDAAAECQRRGLPAPVAELLDHSSDGYGHIHGRLRLSFAVGVLGPIILGRDSHKGGGLFLAVP